ncbi:MAG: YqaE/Pmp3 family membrane protein [Lentisphaerae bacterium]|nr:YqaE/Pmp3 family membrane protein [Lentisphaerota bacterium]
MSNGDVEVTGNDLLVMIIRYLLCLVFPPLAVFDKGCGTMLLVFLFTLFGWLPGTILAFLICLKDRNYFRKS